MNNKKLVLNSISGTFLYLINIIVAFVMSPIMIKVLGNSNYGLWEMVISVVGYMGLLDLGVGPAVLRNVSIAHGAGDKKGLQETISTAMVFFLCIGVLAMMFFVVLSAYPQIVIGTITNGKENFGLVLLLFAVNALLVFPLNVYTAILMGIQKHHVINSSRLILTIIRASLAYYLLIRFSSNGLFVLVFLEIASNALQFIIYAKALNKDISIPQYSLLNCTKRKMRELFGYGAKSALLMISFRLQFASMPLIIGKSLGVASIIYFVLPNRLVDYAKGISLAIGFPLTPYFASIIGTNDEDALKSSWLTTSFVLQIIALAMPVFLYFCGETFIRLWIGDEYATAGRYVLYMLLFGLVAEALTPNARQMLLAKAQHGGVAVVCLVLSICSIPLAFWGAKAFGVAGAAFGSSIVTTIISIITFSITSRVMHVTFKEYVYKTIAPLLIPLLLLGSTLWGTGILLRPNSYGALLLQILGSSFVYCFAVWMVGLSTDKRKACRDHIINKLDIKRLV